MDMRKILLPRVEVGAPEMARSRRGLYAVILLLVAAALATGWWFYGGIAVTTVQVIRGTAAEIVYATGVIEPERWSKVATLVKGRIIERCRCEGQRVKAGDLLARLDDAEAQAALRELRAREEFAQKELDRQSQLVARNVTSVQALERATSELRQIQALIAAQVERLAYYRLVAPMDGVVLREDGEVGEIVDSNVVLYRIGIPKPLQLVAEVNEEDIPKVRVGQTVLLRSDAFPGEPLAGTVREITPAGDPVAKTYRIRVALPEDTPLRVGMSVEANVVTREKADALLVPAAAVAEGAVFVIEHSRAVRRPVELGVRGTRMVEVLSGATEGEWVISPVPSGQRDRTRVRVAGEADPAKR
jgi:membrane fusion protein (multidrug efflux system)